jgi:glucose/arabinose dehydrogenase
MKDNPFVGVANAKEAIYTYGNRNPQGTSCQGLSGNTNTDRKVVTKLTL